MNNDVELIPVKGVLPSVQVQSDNVIYVPQAHKNKAGIVKEGDGVLIENGVVSLNKQTVEDMIDANKWVSYGFQQNLTEDEKGMARHNIGAGDNYFTGSYYDLTQKPHLNTNNTADLDYGDEELNDTINLHKISKTGSFNDLKHVPQEILGFAESERQKSKNLLNFTRPAITSNVKAYNDHIIINGTVEGYVYPYYSSNLPQGVQLKQGNTYTFSRTLLSGTGNKSFKIELSLRNINDTQIQSVTIPSGENSVTFTIESNDIAMYACSLSFTSSATFTDAYYGLQVEEGSFATDYQPYNGQITHNGDAPVVFAESERQKSKNLFPNETVSGTTYTKITLPSPLKVGTYTLSLIATSSDTDVDRCVVSFQGDSDKFLGQANLGRNTRTNGTITLSETCYSLNFYAGTSYNNSNGDTFTYSDIQLEEGSVATDYQPYNGAIVHEKDIADVEHIETIYDMSSTDSNINKGLTSGVPFDNTTELNLGENLTTKYKGLYVYTTIWNTQIRFYCDIIYGQTSYSFMSADPNSGEQTVVSGRVVINNTTGILKGTALVQANLGGSSYTTITDSKYNVYKVEGVLK